MQARKTETIHEFEETVWFYQKLRQATTKLQISVHRIPIETGSFQNKPSAERIYPLRCDSIGD